MTVAPRDALAALWSSCGLRAAALGDAVLSGTEPVLPSSFAVGTASQVSLAAAALAALEVGRLRNGIGQQIAVDMREAALESCGHFTVDGKAPLVWDPVAGLYPCGDGGGGGWVRLHTNFAHHRDGVLRLLGLPAGPGSERATVAAALARWTALDFETAAMDAGLVAAALRSHDEWLHHPQSQAIADLPLVEIRRIGDAPPLGWPELASSSRPLTGLRVLDLTRILAGPIAGRTLAAHGADVMLVNAPHLPNIDAIADTSRGKRSALADLRSEDGQAGLRSVLADAHVFLQAYRPGALAALGCGVDDVVRCRPGIVHASLSAYGRLGPWSARRGFDSLVQTATGFNVDEALAAGVTAPKALPMQVLDMATGFLLAFGIAAALGRQRDEGGSWHVEASLARTGQWLRELGRVEAGLSAPAVDFSAQLETRASGFGSLTATRHAARFSRTPPGYARPSVRPGTDPLSWSPP